MTESRLEMPELKRLTSLRFFFALWVFLSHCGFLFDPESFVYTEIFSFGYVGVGFFFILSGFILSYVYKQSIERGMSWKHFWFLRFSRIYPLYLLTLLITVPIEVRLDQITPRQAETFLSHLFMVQSFIPHEDIVFSFNSPSWSVANEMFFYALFPLAVIHLRKTWILTIFAALCSVGILFYIYPGTAKDSSTIAHFAFYINPMVRLTDFLLGITLFRIHESMKHLPRWIPVTGVAAFVLLFLARNVVSVEALYAIYFYIPIGLIMLSAARNVSRENDVLSHPVLVYLGKISYGLYLFHVPVLRYVSGLLQLTGWAPHGLIVLWISFLMLTAASALSYELFEKPVTNWLRRRQNL